MAGRAATAIDNSRLFAAEQQARELAEAAEARLSALWGASRALATSLDLDATLREAARLATRHLADGAIVYLAEPGMRLVALALAHEDPQRQGLPRGSTVHDACLDEVNGTPSLFQ